MDMELLHINGVTYEVTKALGPKDVSVEQRRFMRKHGKTRYLYVRRPHGRGVTYHVAEYRGPKGTRLYGQVVSIGVM
jgi:hypothetical protein